MELQKEVSHVDLNAIFEMELTAGEQELKTWLIDEQDAEVGAYYVYIKKI